MRFDKVIMNPPYKGSLHLEILSKILTKGSIIVNLSPIRWLEDIERDSERSTKSRFDGLFHHIESIEKLNIFEAIRNFNCSLNSPVNLGIYLVRADTYYDNSSLLRNALLERVCNFNFKNGDFLEDNKKDGYRVKVSKIVASKSRGEGIRKPALSSLGKLLWFYDGKGIDGKPWYEYYFKNQFSKDTETIPTSIKFSSQEECENFIKSFDTPFARYIEDLLISDAHVNSHKVLFMGNAINPRTRLKGYLGEWINEDFYEFFGVTEEEKLQIEEIISKFN